MKKGMFKSSNFKGAVYHNQKQNHQSNS